MSSIQTNQVASLKLLSGGGDGVRNNIQKSTIKRTPVPSCRRFVVKTKTDSIAKQKIEKALVEVNNSKKIPLKITGRSRTMAEITPTKSRNRIQLIDADACYSGDHKAPKKQRSTDAGRLIYQQLLLNAWRRKRVQVSSMIESSQQLQTQVSQLQIQINVLQKLRESECKRRSETASENQLLKTKLEELYKSNQNIKQEKTLFEEIVKTKDNQADNLKTEVENVRNDLIAIRSQLKVSEVQLEKERHKIMQMRKEEKSLKEKIVQIEKNKYNDKQTIGGLQKTIEQLRNDNRALSLLDDLTKNQLNDVESKLQEQIEKNESLKKKLENEKKSREKLNERIVTLTKSLEDSHVIKEELLEDNQAMKKNISNLENLIEEEQKKPWWKNARQLMSAPLNALQNAAVVMLPALTASPDDDINTTNNRSV